jgi:hypothetical protein
VRGSHTFKLGGDWRRDIYANKNRNNTYGSYGFSNQQTTPPSTQGQSLAGETASPMLFPARRANTASISNPSDPQYRKEAWSSSQDS